ncbi:type VI secretion system-associated protein TagF [Beijerinckiaceae bacterium]|nr:type VI secretion system-associated protein TagF [Beijerinckiaceae bacterium]
MRCGLYGKLPAKRDFIAIAVPRAFLQVWEPWMEKGMEECRAHLPDADWKNLFITAPIWRFWLGPSVCGEAIVGAFMPSMDALGRLFPLTLIGISEDKTDMLAPPDIDRHDPWFERVEEFLLSRLASDACFEATVKALSDLGGCAFANTPETEGGSCSKSTAGQFLKGRLAAFRRKPPHPLMAGTTTYWWTTGSESREPQAWTENAMPDPNALGNMMSLGFPNRPRAFLQPG